jgi:hypothetical protein
VRRLLQDSFSRLWPVCHFVEKVDETSCWDEGFHRTRWIHFLGADARVLGRTLGNWSYILCAYQLYETESEVKQSEEVRVQDKLGCVVVAHQIIAHLRFF